MNLEDMWANGSPKQDDILNVRAEIQKDRRPLQKLIDNLGIILTHPFIPLFLILFQIIWAIINLELLIKNNFDPYPYAFLATITSGISPILSILILMNQYRNSSIQELREEISLQMMVHAEQEITMCIRMIHEIQQQLNIKSTQDTDILKKMEQVVDPEVIMKNVRIKLEQYGENRFGTGV